MTAVVQFRAAIVDTGAVRNGVIAIIADVVGAIMLEIVVVASARPAAPISRACEVVIFLFLVLTMHEAAVVQTEGSVGPSLHGGVARTDCSPFRCDRVVGDCVAGTARSRAALGGLVSGRAGRQGAVAGRSFRSVEAAGAATVASGTGGTCAAAARCGPFGGAGGMSRNVKRQAQRERRGHHADELSALQPCTGDHFLTPLTVVALEPNFSTRIRRSKD